MEDACLINKSSLERGLFSGEVYTCESIDLKEKGANITLKGDGSVSYIDSDGLPKVG